ncbi:MAG: dTDP-4-dehydrorhamnose reductase [Chloroflexaceae bacterium]|nr:dTDP-4-dehydrorhamnose reductase [Chloroflexaceae bacterium]
MRIAITGAGGRLGGALCRCLATHHTVIPLLHQDVELRSPETIGQIVVHHVDLVIHTAAYTNVDGCARDPDLAYQINGLGTHYVALACQNLNIPMVYISTNEVFDGETSTPYGEYAPTNPINAYGRSKWAGEQIVMTLLQHFFIVRVSWLFGGERNFIRTVLRLAADPPEGGLRMVEDEVGSPTYAHDAADAIAQLIETPCYGIYHLVNEGWCSRYTLASEVLRQAGHGHVPMTPIRLADYQRESTPPSYTPLANRAGAAFGITLRPWEEAVAAHLAEVSPT